MPSQKMGGDAARGPSPAASAQVQAHPGPDLPASGTQIRTGQDRGSPAPHGEVLDRRGSGTPSGAEVRAQRSSSSGAARLLRRARTFGGLFLVVGLGALLGAVIEGRRWYRALAPTLGRITRAARLPSVVAVAMPTALASCPAADGMLMASRTRGEISESALVAGGMLNGFLAHMAHALRAFFPVAAAIGLPGILFFGIQFGGEALVILLVLALHRARTPAPPQAGDGAGPVLEGPLPWGETLRRGALRSLSLLFRLACVSVPMVLAMEWALRSGLLDFWDRMLPETASRLFPEELLTIVTAQVGGLVQSSAVSAGLLGQGLVAPDQVLLAMLVASAVNNPVRMLRRNLPTALAIFPVRTALAVVLGLQFSRLAVTLAAAALLVLRTYLLSMP